ncbi:ABC transporter permease subunit [Mesorhizobium sp. NPDC059025]|uniref:ABC transporter permease subunit n=1 Tax=unclassified Mesorhizobium TaxID=325217 RepID=UPI0036CB66B9
MSQRPKIPSWNVLGLLPAQLIMLLTLIIPVGIIILVSFSTRGPYGGFDYVFTTAPYKQILFNEGWSGELEFNPQYLIVVARTVILSLATTIVCLALSFPVAYFISLQKTSAKMLLIYLVTLPFWVSMIVRVYSWIIILGNDGVVAKTLRALGLGENMGSLLFTDTAMLIGLVYSYIPLMILPVFASIEKLDPALVEASHDLYGSRLTTLRRVILPLCRPGMAAGGPAWRRQDDDDGQPDPAAVRCRPQLAAGRGHFHRADVCGDDLPALARHSGDAQGRPGGERMTSNVRRYPGFGLFSLIFFVYLYLPIAVVVFYSFNANRIVSNWGGFSLHWYTTALSNAALVGAVKTSLFVATIATVLSTIVALMAALVLVRGRNVRFRRISETVVNLPLLLPEIVVAVAVLILFSEMGLTNGLLKLTIAHTTFCIPFAFLPIRARLQGMDADLEEAARDLYASAWVAFRRVTLPLILPGVFAGAMLAFVISMDDFITSNLLNSGGATTLPVYIFSLIKQGVSPQLNAISTLIMVVSVALATIAFLLQRRQ